MARYHGKKGQVMISTSGSGTASVIVLSKWSLNMPTDKVDVTSFGDGNKVKVTGFKDITGQLAGFWDDTDASLFTAADSTTACKFYLYPSSDAPTKYWYGTAWLDASIETDVNGAVAVTSNFDAAGTWARN
jgi:hypothetical protein